MAAVTTRGAERAVPTLGDSTRSRENAFDLLRLVAAALVIVSHSFALVGRPEPLLGAETFGGLGVVVFFAISGFLVTKSWLLQPRLVPFVVKRALRLMPALLVTVLVCALVIGPIVTTLPLGDYLRSSGTWHYIVGNARLATEYDLPGVFQTTPHDGVNGSLWTLPIETKAYVLIGVIGVLGVLRPLLAPLVVLAVALSIGHDATQQWTGLLDVVPRALGRLALNEVGLRLIGVFCVGALLCVHRHRVPLRATLFYACAGAWVLSLFVGSDAQTIATVVALPYAVLYLGHRRPGRLAAITRPGDVSYGLYLWGFPVQQCVVSVLGPELDPLAMFACALPLTYLVALASWRLVEAPALRLKPRVAVPLRVPDDHGHLPDGDAPPRRVATDGTAQAAVPRDAVG